MKSVMAGVLIVGEAIYDDVPESVKPLKSVAFGMYKNANPSMSFTQLEVLCLTLLEGIFDL